MKKSVTTLQDIANALGVARSTVSKALNDSHEISSETKKTVLEYARQVNYKPNHIAKSLKQGHTRAIGVVVSTIDNHFFSQVINGIESVAYAKGYNVIINQTHESLEREICNVQHLESRSIDGLIISLSTETKDVQHLIDLNQRGVSVVLVDRVSEELNTHKVIANNFRGAYDAVSHLLLSGFKRIAHITSSVNSSITAQRLAGYGKALSEHGIEVNSGYIKYCQHGGRDVKEIQNAINELMTLDQRPDAIFTASDRITTTTMSILLQSGLKIPEDIALIGFTNTLLAEHLNPSLSTVYQPGFEMGKKSMELLVELIESKELPDKYETFVLATELFARKSSVKY